jgi:hypothetical protein
MDITEIILSDHEEQRRMFARMDDIDRSDTATLGKLWTRLSAMLEVHAQAEEEYFYPELLKLGERLVASDEVVRRHSIPRAGLPVFGRRDLHDATEVEETKDAISDHNDIRDGILAAAANEVGSKAWWKGVTDAREANDEHMGEEEHEGLADFRRHVDLETRHRIAVLFVAYEAEHVTGVPVVDKNPDEYIEENS